VFKLVFNSYLDTNFLVEKKNFVVNVRINLVADSQPKYIFLFIIEIILNINNL